MGAKILVVGGAGYIGSVCAAALRSAGHQTVVLDDLSTGHREAVPGELVVADVRDRQTVARVLREGRFDAVMHFAAKSQVGESMRAPVLYYDVNMGGTAALLDAMDSAGVKALVFSSTCAIYGDPAYLPLDEAHPKAPVSTYGDSKAMVERMLDAAREREGFRITALRYFNAAGAMPDGSLGESHDPETHLIPIALQAALGKRPPLSLFGDDYETRDGTCVRDYIHVLDLAEAHRLAMERLLDGDPGDAYNVGTGVGTTVREIMEAIHRVSGRPVPHAVAARREGDPPALYARADKIQQALGWEPRWLKIDDVVQTALRWARSPRY
jgi:UDP-glucose-4-epimerase GalE